MLIEGPIRVAVQDDEFTQRRSLHITFDADFQAASLGDRTEQFSDYVTRLQVQTAQMEEDTPTRQGMLIILQIAEEMLPHIEADAIPLEETIVVEIEQAGLISSLLQQ